MGSDRCVININMYQQCGWLNKSNKQQATRLVRKEDVSVDYSIIFLLEAVLILIDFVLIPKLLTIRNR